MIRCCIRNVIYTNMLHLNFKYTWFCCDWFRCVCEMTGWYIFVNDLIGYICLRELWLAFVWYQPDLDVFGRRLTGMFIFLNWLIGMFLREVCLLYCFGIKAHLDVHEKYISYFWFGCVWEKSTWRLWYNVLIIHTILVFANYILI